MNVIPVLDRISIDTANELQNETGGFYPKDSYLTNEITGEIVSVNHLKNWKRRWESWIPDVFARSAIPDQGFYGYRRKQKYSQAPPTRLLSMVLFLEPIPKLSFYR